MSLRAWQFRLALACLLVCLFCASPVSAQQNKGGKFALLVGVKNYKHDKLPPLRFTENDVIELAALLRPAGYQVTLLTDSAGAKSPQRRPTTKNIRDAVKDLIAKREKNDTILVALAGHGVQMTVKENGSPTDVSFFCPVDAQLNDQKKLISLKNLFADMELCGAGVKLLLVDACRNELASRGTRAFDTDSIPRPPRGVAALFSCAAGEKAFESPKLGQGHGVFFHHVILGLRGAAKDSDAEVDWDSLAKYVKRSVSRQVPRLIGDGAQQTPHEVKNLVGDSPVLLKIKDVAVVRAYVQGAALLRGSADRLDQPQGAKLLLQAADKGHALARGLLAMCYSRGVGVRRDVRKARQYAEKAQYALILLANEGDAEALYLLGVFSADGIGEEKDAKEAIRSYRKAAEKEHADAMYQLGEMYVTGRGVGQDDKEAVLWFRRAAEKKHPTAMTNLGVMYATGRGVGQDEKEAVRWYRNAADKEDVNAMTNLAGMYATGRGVEQDDKEAVRWYRKAAEQENPRAMTSLAVMYANGNGVAKDDKEAVRWYRKAANKGDVDAMTSLGGMYAFGIGVPKNEKEGVFWYRKAADKGDAGAMTHLGWMYANGSGVEKDEKEAAVWFRKAADKGDADAMTNLALMYELGRGGLAKDSREALRWYRKAAKLGNKNALAKLKKLGE